MKKIILPSIAFALGMLLIAAGRAPLPWSYRVFVFDELHQIRVTDPTGVYTVTNMAQYKAFTNAFAAPVKTIRLNGTFNPSTR